MQAKKIKKTSQRLIEAASDVFAERGFKDATISEICERAQTNIASVNYHFGDKEKLYAQAWRYSFRESLKKYPPDGGISDDAPAHERLLGRVKSIIGRILDENHREFAIMLKEIANPTGLLKELINDEIKPIREKMRELVNELLGPNVTEKQRQFCNLSIMSQCFHMMMIRKSALNIQITIDDIEAFAEHIVQFSLAGISAIRQEALTSNNKTK